MVYNVFIMLGDYSKGLFQFCFKSISIFLSLFRHVNIKDDNYTVKF